MLMTKRIVICSDGTWNRPDQRCPTNVVKIARSIAPIAPDKSHQVVFYDEGVGTGPGLDRWMGGVFGSGLDKNIEDAYRFLMYNYEEGDAVFLFGFSRGAYTVRSTAGLIRKVGLLKKIHAERFPEAYRLYRKRDPSPDTPEATEFRRDFSREIEIKFMGVWDTVGALGIPLQGLRALTMSRHRFHNVTLSQIVKNAYQALAIDERRGEFEPTLWESVKKPGQVVEQVWFAGAHSDVGGGYEESGLSDVAFLWMEEKARECGLAFDETYIIKAISPDGLGPVHNSKSGLFRWTRGRVRQLGKQAPTEAIHPYVVERHKNGQPPYRPENLLEYLKDPQCQIAKVKDPYCSPRQLA
jgi:uncharacterized protein (DUF2235 family)